MKLYLPTKKNKKITKSGDKCVANSKIMIQKKRITVHIMKVVTYRNNNDLKKPTNSKQN